ncbi:hypothetical protein J1605_015298 [Eschrichtius robustus]|uniref:Guanine nucleotide-binding protein subunit beta-like protein 1 n=1 Tax=Eschrichtius robustus TaxID=9764 RepID=A0AB34GB69_ESCRO|nr:hypothetical protein J1605_015298 [Eschrichtius robustus]
MAAPPLPPPDPQFVLRGAQSAVHALHFCEGAQGQGRPLLLSGSLRGLVHIWSLQTRRVVATLDGHGGQCVTWLQTLPQGPQLLRYALMPTSLTQGQRLPGFLVTRPPAPTPIRLCPALLLLDVQGRDLKLCVWDLAEGRNAVVDSVLLESVGFCRGSVLAGGLQRWMLAVPGRGSDEVSEPIHPWLLAAGMLCPEQLLRPALAWSPEVALVLGVGKGA